MHPLDVSFVCPYRIMMLRAKYYGFRDWFSKWFVNLPTLILVSGIAILIGSSIGYLWGSPLVKSSAETFLSTIALAQASILAITFSVTILGIQLVSNKYSPRMVELFFKNRLFLSTFSVFVISIGFDLYLLLNLPENLGTLSTAGIYAAAGFAASIILWLYLFVISVIKKSTPDGIISAFVNDLTPAKYLHRVRSVANDSSSSHPLQPLRILIMNAISNHDRTTAETGIKYYGEKADSILDYFIQNEQIDEFENGVKKELYKPVLEEQLPDIAVHAQEHNESDLVQDTIGVQQKIGVTGLNSIFSLATRPALNGLINTSRDIPSEIETYGLHSNIWGAVGGILESAARNEELDAVYNTLIRLDSSASTFFQQDANPHIQATILISLFESLQSTQTKMLSDFGTSISDVDLDWGKETPTDDLEHFQELKTLNAWRNLFSDLIQYKLMYVDDDIHIQYQIRFVNIWEQVAIDASKSPVKDYAVMVCRMFIEAAYISISEGTLQKEHWRGLFVEIMEDGDPKVVRSAFEDILGYEQVNVADIEYRRDQIYGNMVVVPEYHPLNTHEDFPGKLYDLYSDVRKVYNFRQSIDE